MIILMEFILEAMMPTISLNIKFAMKIYDTLNTLKSKLEETINIAENETIKSIIGYEFYLKFFYSVFKE